MREAIGATWIMGIVMAFVALFSAYLAFSINYSKAFKIKDGIVERLEKYNGPNEFAINEINQYMSSVGYNAKGKCDRVMSSDVPYAGVNHTSVDRNPSGGKYNYCIQKVTSRGEEGQMSSAYYKVTVFFSLSLPIISNYASFNVSGETINIYYPEDNYFSY